MGSRILIVLWDSMCLDIPGWWYVFLLVFSLNKINAEVHLILMFCRLCLQYIHRCLKHIFFFQILRRVSSPPHKESMKLWLCGLHAGTLSLLRLDFISELSQNCIAPKLITVMYGTSRYVNSSSLLCENWLHGVSLLWKMRNLFTC